MELIYHELDNGIRLVHHTIPGMVAHCGLIINTGSRNEFENEHGIAHLIEHMLFKGTRKRKAYYVLSRLDDVGGELNAYTTKEETAIYASFIRNDYERAVEIISDIAFNSVFPGKEIEKEKDVIIEEINSYLDNPAELIFDEFEEMIFSGQPIGRSILGTPETIKGFKQEDLTRFITNNYFTDQMVFCSVGNISRNRILKLFRKHFADQPAKISGTRSGIPWMYKPGSVTKQMNTFQNHCITGNIAYNLKDDRRVRLFILNNILGGQGLNSRLNLSLREKNGLAYNVESNYNPYFDTGVFSVYFGTDTRNMDKSFSIVMNELKRLRTVKLGVVQLSKARNQIKGYLARGYENHESLMLSLGKSLLIFGKIDTPEETFLKIDEVSSSDLLDTANEVFESSRLSTLIYK